MLQNVILSCFGCCKTKEKDAKTADEEPTETSRLLQEEEGNDTYNNQVKIYGTQRNDQPEYSAREVHVVHAAQHHINTLSQTVKELNAIADRLDQASSMFTTEIPKAKRKRKRFIKN